MLRTSLANKTNIYSKIILILSVCVIFLTFWSAKPTKPVPTAEERFREASSQIHDSVQRHIDQGDLEMEESSSEDEMDDTEILQSTFRMYTNQYGKTQPQVSDAPSSVCVQKNCLPLSVLDLYLWEGKAIIILQRALTSENMNVYGKLLRGHQDHRATEAWPL